MKLHHEAQYNLDILMNMVYSGPAVTNEYFPRYGKISELDFVKKSFIVMFFIVLQC